MNSQAQGWYRDPYGLHEDRYFSAGKPTKLVRDGARESYDPPPYDPQPDRPLTSDELDPVPPAEGEDGAGAHLRRDGQQGADLGRARRAVIDYFEQLPKN